MTYFVIKSLHILFVMAWMATVFYLPRILVNVAETAGEPAIQGRLLQMGRRLYKFGHMTFGFAFIFGLTLWLGHMVTPVLPQVVTGHWIDAKLAGVVILLAYFIWMGKLLSRSEAGAALPSARTLRLFNELPVLVVFVIILLVLAKPF
jgi:protoporphyrinogen IX oxidase